VKVCSQCKGQYASNQQFCPIDGAKLDQVLPVTAFDSGGKVHPIEGVDYPSLFGDDNNDQVEEEPDSAPGIVYSKVPEVDQLLGTVVDDCYEVLSVIGKGGMSVVYVARDTRLKKIVALKMMHPYMVANPLHMQRFRQEAEAASNLSHPNIITVHNFGLSKTGRPYLVMDYCSGMSLASLIAEKEHLEIERAVPVFIQIAGALAHAHEKGVIHRDLKPSNILLVDSQDQKDVVKVVDFGIAKILPKEGREAAELTHNTGKLFGSPLYMSPEQCRGEKPDARSDVYSMGCLMYESLMGTPSVRGNNALDILFKQVNEMPPSFSQSNPNLNLPPQLEAIVFKALAKNPSDRYQSMLALRSDLIKFQREYSRSVIDSVATKFKLNWLKRRIWKDSDKILFGAGAAALLIVLGLAGWLTAVYISAATSPYSTVPVTWKENDLSDGPLLAPAEILKNKIAADAALFSADKVLQQAQGTKLSADSYKPLEEEVKTLDSLAGEMVKLRLWEQAQELYSKALYLSELKLDDNSGEAVLKLDSLSREKMTLNLATCYFKSKQYSLAAKQYERLLVLERGLRGHTITQTYASLGDCFYFQGNWMAAEKAYGRACLKWLRAPDPVTNKPYSLSWYFPIKNEVVLVTVGRRADTARELAQQQSESKEQSEFNRQSAFLYQTCANSWQAAGSAGLQDLAVSHFYWAQVGQNLSANDFARIQNAAEFSRGKTLSINDLYVLSCDEMRQAVGEKSPVMAAVLKGYSDYLFSQSDYANGWRVRIEHMFVLSQSSLKRENDRIELRK
jgi:serine/threonine protein kinase